jgi:hypothetical protein
VTYVLESTEQYDLCVDAPSWMSWLEDKHACCRILSLERHIPFNIGQWFWVIAQMRWKFEDHLNSSGPKPVKTSAVVWVVFISHKHGIELTCMFRLSIVLQSRYPMGGVNMFEDIK